MVDLHVVNLAVLMAAQNVAAGQLPIGGLTASRRLALVADVRAALLPEFASVAEQLAEHGAALAAHGAALAAQGATLAELRTQVASLQVAGEHNYGCGEGGVRPYVAVPNGLSVAAGEAPLTCRDDLLALSEARVLRWCAHYGVPAQGSLAQGRRAVAAKLGLAAGVVA